MRTHKTGLSTAAMLAAVLITTGYSTQPRAIAQATATRPPVEFAEWPLPANDRAYGTIDGKHLLGYVDEEVGISRRYRDQGHQFWGRIIGTSGDAESAQWLLDKFNKFGLTETHIQPLDLGPQWMPQSWEITASGGGKSLPLTTAQPGYRSTGTDGHALDVEVVYVGLGSEADYAGRDVKGKAVLISRYPTTFRAMLRRTAPEPGVLKRAEAKGAVAIFDVNEMPGNLRFQSYPTNTNVPTFSLGSKDGQAVRTMIEQAPAGQPAHLHVSMDIQMVPNLKTALVFGTLPGATDETIYVIAHRDGWFDAAGDNAAGVASMLGLVEYFAKVPKAQRRRTMVFIGWDGHHNSGPGGSVGAAWIATHKDELFKKTALIINDEHPASVDTYQGAGTVGRTNTYVPLQWYAGGPARPALGKIAVDAFHDFGVVIWDKQSVTPPAGDMGPFYKFLPGVVAQSNDFFYFHTDANSPETIPWTALEAVTRAYAKIVDQVNKLDLKDLQLPPQADSRLPGAGNRE